MTQSQVVTLEFKKSMQRMNMLKGLLKENREEGKNLILIMKVLILEDIIMIKIKMKVMKMKKISNFIQKFGIIVHELMYFVFSSWDLSTD